MTEENKITEEEQMQITMGMIINAGNAKAFAVEAITCAKNGDFEGAKAKLKNADQALVEAHNTQTGMLTQEAQGNHVNVTLLTVHSQDHLMNAITFLDLAKDLVDVYERVAGLEN